MMTIINYCKNKKKCGVVKFNTKPNCAACRVLINTDVKQINDNGDRVWQGATGLFYCGQKFAKSDDGYCGPNNGPSCQSCAKLIPCE